MLLSQVYAHFKPELYHSCFVMRQSAHCFLFIEKTYPRYEHCFITLADADATLSIFAAKDILQSVCQSFVQ